MEQNLGQYRIFFEVAKTGNISKAAANLYMSQPAVSKAVSKLEDNLGLSLFERKSRGVKLTVEGNLLYEKLGEAFEAIDDAEKQLQRYQMAKVGMINIASSTALARYILFKFLGQFSDENPYIFINLHTQDAASALKNISEGRLDLGLVALKEPPKNLEVRKLGDIHDVMVATPQYIQNIRHVIGEKCNLLEDGKVLVLNKNNVSRQLFDEYTARKHLTIDNLFEISTMDIIIELCKINLGVGVVTREYVEEELKSGKLVEVQPSKEVAKRSIYLVYQAGNQNPALKKFIELTER